MVEDVVEGVVEGVVEDMPIEAVLIERTSRRGGCTFRLRLEARVFSLKAGTSTPGPRR
jgi:hypothetical protein